MNTIPRVKWLWPVGGLMLGVWRWLSPVAAPWLVAKQVELVEQPGVLPVLAARPDEPFVISNRTLNEITFSLLDRMDGRVDDSVIETIDTVRTLAWLTRAVADGREVSFETLLDNVVTTKKKPKPATR